MGSYYGPLWTPYRPIVYAIYKLRGHTSKVFANAQKPVGWRSQHSAELGWVWALQNICSWAL